MFAATGAAAEGLQGADDEYEDIGHGLLSDSALAPQTAQIGIETPERGGLEVPEKEIQLRRGETVFDRRRPEVAPIGLRAGSFLIFPGVDVVEEYNDNIFATEDDEESDFITRLQPDLTIESDWNNHLLRLNGYGDFGFYADNSDENYEDYGASIGGRLDVRRSTNVRAVARYDHRHEERSSPDDVNGSEPTEYDRFGSTLVGSHRLNRLRFMLRGDYQALDFDDVPRAVGPDINNDDRDRQRFEGALNIGYEIQPSYLAFVEGSYNVVDYDDAVDDNGVDRDNDGYQVTAGIEIDFGGLMFGNFFAGYRDQTFDDPVLDDASGVTGGADVTWNVTPLTTLIGSASSTVRESTTTDTAGNISSSRIFTTIGLEAQHELLRNLLLGATASYSRDDFQGISRTDNIYRFGLSATYLIHRHAYLSADYSLRTRDSDAPNQDFLENAVFLTLQLQY